MIQDVKELSPELNVEGFRDFRYVVVLECREIDVDQARPDHRIPPGIAKQVHAGTGDWVAIFIKREYTRSGERSGCKRNTEAVNVDVAVDVAGDGIAASRP